MDGAFIDCESLQWSPAAKPVLYRLTIRDYSPFLGKNNERNTVCLKTILLDHMQIRNILGIQKDCFNYFKILQIHFIYSLSIKVCTHNIFV